MADMSLKKELVRLRAITRIHHNIGANLELEEISRIIVRELVDILDCNACAIILLDKDNIKILAERGFSKAYGKLKLDRTSTIIQSVINDQQSIFTGDVSNSPFTSYIPPGTPINSLILIPIALNHDVKGFVHLDSHKKDAFNEEDFHLSQILTDEIAVAIQRSFIYANILDISIRDGLTGCFNRKKFDLDLQVELASARQEKSEVSLLMIDVDWFKKYNDFHGHPKGDELLKKVVGLLKSHTRPYDRTYRYGGEEFAVLLFNTIKENAVIVANRLQKTIEQEEFEGEADSQPEKKITVSIGVASFPKDAKTVIDLIKAADSMLYRAKESGRNRVRIYGLGAR
jgi:diguanylate cyclase (GGDEF)-like protein